MFSFLKLMIIEIHFKGTVDVVSRDPLDSQQYPWNLLLIYNMKNNFVSLGLKKCLILIISPLFLKQEMKRKQKHGYISHTWSDRAFKGTVVNRT